MRILVLAVLAVLALLTMAAPAGAGGTLLPDSESHVRWGPLFAGESLTWATPDAEPAGYRIHTAKVDGSGHSTRTIEAPVRRFGTTTWFAMGASDRRTAVSLHLIHCEPACKIQSFEFPYSKVLSAGADGPFEPFGVPCVSAYPSYASVAVDGDVVAYLTCNEVVVHDFGAPEGQPREFRYPGEMRVRLAGPYLASFEPPGVVVVREWRTGAERLRVRSLYGFGDIGPDGTVVYVDGDNRVMAASPSAPEPRVLATGGGGRAELAGDRVAYTRVGGGVAVRRLDGSLVTESPTAGLEDFNGERVAWVDRTCARTAIATWDLAGEAPSLPRANPCPIGSLRSSRLRMGPGGASVKLSCAPEPAVGCAGQIALFAKDSRPKYAGRIVDMAAGTYALRPGERGTFPMAFGKRRGCIVGRNGLRPLLRITGPPKPDGTGYRVKERRVTLAGLDTGTGSCSS